MTSLAENGISKAENIVRDIQTERMIYQISSESSARKTSDRLKKTADETYKAMENARNIAQEKKIEIDELKINLAEKKEKMKKIQQDLERASKKVETTAKKTLEYQTEENKIKAAIEIVREASESAESKYLEQSQNELADSLIKASLETEKTQSELNAAKRKESKLSEKLIEIETEINKVEADTINKIQESDRIIANIANTIDHIVRSYEEISSVSKDLLNSAITTKIDFEETPSNQINQYQQAEIIEKNNPEYA